MLLPSEDEKPLINDNQIVTSEKEFPHEEEAQADISEVDLGNIDQQDSEELITFTHSYLNYRLCKCFETYESLSNTSFGLLLSNEFLLGDNVSIESLTPTSSSDFVKNVKDKCYRFPEMNDREKTNFVDNLLLYTKELGFQDTVEFLLPVIIKLHDEKEQIIETFLKVFPKFLDLIVEFGEKGYKIIKEHLVRELDDIFKRKNEKLNELCCECLVYLSQFIKQDDKGDCILTLVIVMAHDDKDSSARMLSLKLFNDLANNIGRELCELYVVPQVASFADEQDCKVRKAVAVNLGNICMVVSDQILYNRLIPVYQKLSKDSIWTVRKASAEILPKLTKRCNSTIVSTVLLDVFQSFAQDIKNYVRFSAIEVFGEFISMINKDDAKNCEVLLNFYINTIRDYKLDKKSDSSIIAKCAFNFPAVLLFYGKEQWEKLKPCYIQMAEEKEDKVRIPLAASLGEISKILGSEITANDLLEFVEKFYKMGREMQLKVLEVLPDIIRNLPQSQKSKYLEYLKVMINSKEKWRKRLQYCKIIGKYHNTYEEEIIYKRVFPIAINFCFDDVNQVRKKSAKSNSRMILQLILNGKEYKEKTMNVVKAFARSINYQYRQLFILMCTNVFENKDVYEKDIKDLLFDLAYDKVVIVRITLAKFISKLLSKKKFDWVNKDDTIRKIVNILKKDKNEEIKVAMEKVEVDFIEVEDNRDVNQLFVDNMKFISNEFGITKNVPLKSIVKKDVNSTDNGMNEVEIPKKVEETKEGETKKEEEKKEETKTE